MTGAAGRCRLLSPKGFAYQELQSLACHGVLFAECFNHIQQSRGTGRARTLISGRVVSHGLLLGKGVRVLGKGVRVLEEVAFNFRSPPDALVVFGAGLVEV